MSSPFFTFFNFFYIIKGPHRKGVKRGARCTPYHVTINSWGEHPEGLKGVILPYTRHSFVSGNRGLCNLHLKYEGDSLRAVFWNCPKPYILEVYRISLDTSTAKFVGFFWCEWDYCIPTSIAKNYNEFFFINQVPFEGSYPYDTPSDRLLYRPLQALLGHFITFLEVIIQSFSYWTPYR